MRKITAPMMSESPTATCANASMTWPAYPSPSTSRVDATLIPSRKSVATSRREGNTEKSRGFFTNMLVSSTTSAKRMLMMMRMSSSQVGIGTTSSMMMPTTAIGTASFAAVFTSVSSEDELGVCHGVGALRRAAALQ